jgi:hypothetical protein
MTRFLLLQWEAIELFCRVVCKYENLQGRGNSSKSKEGYRQLELEDFKNNTFLMQTLRKYENTTHSKRFSDIYLRPIAEQQGNSRYYPKTLYDLSREIRYSIPIVRSMDELLLLHSFIDDIKPIPYRAIESWYPDNKLRTFENTRWWIYYYQEFIDTNTGETQWGITRAALHLKEFTKLTIENIIVSNGESYQEVKYSGHFSIDKNLSSDYLILESSSLYNQGENINMIINIGNNEYEAGEIALGQYYSINNTINTGVVILERISQRGSMKAAFFKNGDINVSKVLWNFFGNKNNYINVSSGIRSKVALNRWLDTKK